MVCFINFGDELPLQTKTGTSTVQRIFLKPKSCLKSPVSGHSHRSGQPPGRNPPTYVDTSIVTQGIIVARKGVYLSLNNLFYSLQKHFKRIYTEERNNLYIIKVKFPLLKQRIRSYNFSTPP